MKYHFKTESGSRYLIDMDAKTMIRVPDAEGDDLEGDFKKIDWDSVTWPPTIGRGMFITWKNGVKLRMTSPVTEVVKIDTA